MEVSRISFSTATHGFRRFFGKASLRVLTAAEQVAAHQGHIVRRIVRWVDKVARGKDDRRLSVSKAEFVEGGAIGPVSGKEIGNPVHQRRGH